MAGIQYLVLIYGLLALFPLFDALYLQLENDKEVSGSNHFKANLTCLKCDNVARPTACKFIDRCGPHEVCSIISTVTPIGSIVFTLGCIDRNFCGARKRDIREQEDGSSTGTEICNECCTGNLCNAAGCGQTGFSPNLGPVCHFCDLHIGPSSCPEIKQCGRDQICDIRPVKVDGSHDDWYQSQCIHTNMCNGGHTISTDTCSVCCSTNVCNNQVPAHCHAILVPTHDPVTTLTAITNAPIVTNAPVITNAPHTSSSGCQYLGKSVVNEYMGSCYAYSPIGMTWLDAENKCQEHGGHLVTINDANENTFILQMFNDGQLHRTIWIGLNKQQHKDQFTWISGSSSTFTQFIYGDRQYDPDAFDCVIYNLTASAGHVTGWTDTQCNFHKGFICEMPTQTTNGPTASSAGSLPQIYGDPSSCSQHTKDHAIKRNAILYGVTGTTHCYTLMKNNYHWSQAQGNCESDYNAHLVDIGDIKELTQVLQFLHQYIPDKSVWIGLHLKNGNYKWTSGTTSSYYNWNTDPDTHNNVDTHLCAYMTVNDGKWNLAHCGDNHGPNGEHDKTHYFLCEHDPFGQSAIVG